MKKLIPLLITVTLFTGRSTAQVCIEPVIGYQIDLNNKKGFKQINSAIQFHCKVTKYYGLVFQLQKGWPVSAVSRDSSFTANPALPVYVNARKTIRPAALSFAIGHRIIVAGKKKADNFSVIFYTGVTSQKIDVSYAYDRNNYTILNPDLTQKRVSIFFSGGIEYIRLIKNARLFAQLVFATEPIGRNIKYPSSFQFMAPLSFNAGYSIPSNKTKHEK
jgi:hypothetical protein